MAVRARHVLVAAAFTLLSGCTGDGSSSATATTAAAEAPPTTASRIDPTRRSQEIRTLDGLGDVDVITAIEQPRYLEGTARITVPVRFDGEGRFRVTGIAVRTPRFAPLAIEAIDVSMVPGQRVALQVDLGPPRCGDVEASEPLVHLDVSVDDAPPAALALPVPAWLIDELHEAWCAEAAVAEQVMVRFGEPGRADRASLRTEIVLERIGGDEPVALTELTGSVILVVDPVDDAAPLGRLGPGDGVERVPITVTAARCDAHSVSGSTKTFVFHGWLQVGEAPPVRLDIRPDPALEAAMSEAIEACIASIDTDPRDG